MLSFGEKIKAARKMHKFTQKQLAEKIGAAHNSVSDWENNKNKPDPDMIEVLCGVLDITPNYLLASYPDDFSPEEKLIIKKYRGLDTHGKEMVDFTLEKEWERSATLKEQVNNIAEFPQSHLDVNATNDRNATLEQEHNADKIMTDDNEWK